MARPERSNAAHRPSPLSAQPVEPILSRTISDHQVPLGGPVGQMHADLVRRLGQNIVGMPDDVSLGERFVRRLSATAGYGALMASYAGIAFLILR